MGRTLSHCLLLALVASAAGHVKAGQFLLAAHSTGAWTLEEAETIQVNGSIGELASPLDHLAFSKGISHWVAKHNAYSSKEAELLASGLAVEDASLRQALFARDFHQRRVAQKAIFYELPGRPVIKWLYMMFVRGAVLDGHAGVTYATLQAIYEYLIEVKRREILRRQAGKPL